MHRHGKDEIARDSMTVSDRRPAAPEVISALMDLAELALQASAAIDAPDRFTSMLLERLLTLCAASQGALLLMASQQPAAEQPPAYHILALSGPPAATVHTLLATVQPLAANGQIVPGDPSWLAYTLPIGQAQKSSANGCEPADQSAAALLLLGWPANMASTAIEQARSSLSLVATAAGAAITALLLAQRLHELEGAHAHNIARLQEAQAACAAWEQTFDAITAPISVVTADYRLLRANAAYWRWHGRDDTHHRANGHQEPGYTYHCFAAGPGRDTPCTNCPLPRTIQTRRPGFGQQERMVATGPDGQPERRVYQTWTYPIVNAEGEVDRVVEMIQDVTELERLRQAMSEIEALRAADRLKAELLGVVSHELRSPLTAIQGYAATLRRHQRRLSQAERQEFLLAIENASSHLGTMIDRLLTMSQLATGTVTMERLPVDAARLAREAITTAIARDEQTRQIAILEGHSSGRCTYILTLLDIAGLPAQTVPRVFADPRHLRMLLDQLLENASKYSPNGGIVEVVLQPVLPGHIPVVEHGPLNHTGDITTEDAYPAPDHLPDAALQPALAPYAQVDRPMLAIRVRDSGVGIPASHLGRIFTPFHQGDMGLTREIAGLGLGLAICQHIVTLHQGTIWAESWPGKGSVFHVLLPIAENVTAEKEPSDSLDGSVTPGDKSK